MAEKKKNWTAAAVAGLKPRDKRYSVTIGFGLSLKIQTSGAKSWVFRQSINGRVIDKMLGHYPEMSLAEAKQKARKLRQEAGLEPLKGYTFSDAFLLWKNLKKGRLVNYLDEKRRIETHVISKIGRKQIDEITAPLIIQVVRPIEDAGHQATLKNVLMRVSEIMELAVCAGYIRHNPVAKISKVFAPAESTPMPSQPWQKLVEVMNVVAELDEKVQVLFLWQLTSMLRPKESVSVRFGWIEGNELMMPSWVMKKRREFHVPVTDFMWMILEKAKKLYGKPRSDFVFAGRKSGKSISPQTLAKKLHGTSLSGELVAHGLRAIGRTWLADQKVRFEVAEACLSHVFGSTSSRVYLRADYYDERIEVMRAWSQFVWDCAQRSNISIISGLISK